MPKHNPIDDTIPQRVARYDKLVSYKDSMNTASGIPQEAMLIVRPPIRICIESAGLNVHLLPDPFSLEDRL